MPDPATTRPRVEGDREQEILDATLTVLADAGYDRLTMDAVAAEAKASKATLYRRWSSKPALVVDAVCSHKVHPAIPDTGSLRGDLLAAHSGMGGLNDTRALAVQAAVVTAMARDAEFAATYRRDFLGPKLAAARTIFERARARGEIRDDVDLDLVAPALPGIVLHRVFLLGDEATPDLVTQVIDEIILPAVSHRP
ncbi:TetR/AcrR family transcriptional regulator [Nocardioides sp. GXQ0305]|uniref:TetR/AcrR family transcriptional regulator n=1 Tax=Nocardioides sp. GXQ0305 TaxID=3423912 RepID=UPI003D7D922A